MDDLSMIGAIFVSARQNHLVCDASIFSPNQFVTLNTHLCITFRAFHQLHLPLEPLEALPAVPASPFPAVP